MPIRRRKSSATSIDLSCVCPSPTSSGYTSRKLSSSRRSSQYSIRTPSSPQPPSSYGRTVDLSDLIDAADKTKTDHSDSALGNLADELASAFEEENEGDALPLNVKRSIMDENNPPVPTMNGLSTNQMITVPLSQGTRDRPRTLSSPSKVPHRPKHRREESPYNGSDCGDNSDLDAASVISPSLEARMAAVEFLASRGIEDNGNFANSAAARVASSLKDLPPQSGVENGTSRSVAPPHSNVRCNDAF